MTDRDRDLVFFAGASSTSRGSRSVTDTTLLSMPLALFSGNCSYRTHAADRETERVSGQNRRLVAQRVARYAAPMVLSRWCTPPIGSTPGTYSFFSFATTV